MGSVPKAALCAPAGIWGRPPWAPPVTRLYLLRFGEMTLKSPPVRRLLERALRRNLQQRLLQAHIEAVVRSDHGHLYLQVDATGAAATERVVRTTFGITSFSPVVKVEATMDAIVQAGVDLAHEQLRPGQSFAVRPRRTGSHPFSSMEVGRIVGSAVFESLAPQGGVRVDLHAPQWELSVEVRDHWAYLTSSREVGPGGMPYGTQGAILAVLHDTASAAAAWLLMRRGCTLRALLLPGGENQVPVLRAWVPGFKTSRASSTIEGQGWAGVLAEAAALAPKRGAKAIVCGLTFDQMGQTIPKGPLPVFFPLTGFDASRRARLIARVADPDLFLRQLDSGVAAGDDQPPRSGAERAAEALAQGQAQASLI